jgi:ferrous iron transport protein A
MKLNGYTLATLKRGQKGVIKSVDTRDPHVQRLMEMGLVEGTEIEHASSAIGGDPIEFRLFGCGISLRQEHARYFQVAPVAAGD